MPNPKDKTPPANANGHAPEGDPPAHDLKSLSDDELALLTVEAPRELERRKAKREAELLAFFREQAMVLGIPLARLRAALSVKSASRVRAPGGTDGRSVVKAKYWCVTDHSLRWSGRGVAPKWYADHIAAGGKPEDMLIPEGAL